MLFLSESGWMLPEIPEVAEVFDREYDEPEYERTISGLIRRARKRSDKRKSQLWSNAIKRLRRGDHYLLVMIDEAGGQFGWSRGEIIVVSIMIGAFVIFVAMVAWHLGHIPRRNELGFYLWVAAWVVLGIYLAIRLLFGSPALIGRSSAC